METVQIKWKGPSGYNPKVGNVSPDSVHQVSRIVANMVIEQHLAVETKTEKSASKPAKLGDK